VSAESFERASTAVDSQEIDLEDGALPEGAPGTDAPDTKDGSAPELEALEKIVEDSNVIFACGPGGVGKTTVAATLALHAARRGARSCVVTVDPARRLANALGLATLSNDPHEIPRAEWAEAEDSTKGRFFALMLDAKATFDALVRRYANSEEQAERIVSNRFYQNIAEFLSGTQEYMAMEKLFELTNLYEFDLVVVDTPPSRNALDLLEAPERLVKFLDARVFRYFLAPTGAYLRAVGAAGRGVMKMVAKAIGSNVIDDAAEFFAAFEGMYEGFKDRARAVSRLMRQETTAYVLVSSPRKDAAEESSYFADRLQEAGHRISVLIVNRMHPRFSPLKLGAAAGRAAALSGLGKPGAFLAEMYELLETLDGISDGEAENLADLAGKCSPAPVVVVPVLSHDVADLRDLRELEWYLFP
jgi:anion-transporting  ArsA/GET3 family ATPase